MPTPNNAPSGETISFRSGLEEKLAAQLRSARLPIRYEALTLEYTPTKPKRYIPDFILPNGIIIEAKGYFESKDRTKHLTVRSQHPELDLRFVFGNPKNRVGKESTTTYAMWADTKGFLWADKFIPLEWLRERPNEKSLAALRKLGLDI